MTPRGMSRDGKHQLNLPATEVPNPERGEVAFRKTEDPAKDAAYRLSAELFDEACGDPERGGLTNKEIAYLWKCSEDLPRKMRAPQGRACPSFVQLLLLPPAFHYRLHRAMNRHYGFGRALLRELLDLVGAVAAVSK